MGDFENMWPTTRSGQDLEERHQKNRATIEQCILYFLDRVFLNESSWQAPRCWPLWNNFRALDATANGKARQRKKCRQDGCHRSACRARDHVVKAGDQQISMLREALLPPFKHGLNNLCYSACTTKLVGTRQNKTFHHTDRVTNPLVFAPPSLPTLLSCRW